MSVPSIRFARSQARRLAEQLLECARDASAALGYDGGRAAPPLITTNRRQP